MSQFLLFPARHFWIVILLAVSSCSAQEQEQQKKPSNFQYADRDPSAAGKFYPGEKGELNNMLKQLFADAKPKTSDNVLAIILPHAGYVYSGVVAATAINQIDTGKIYKDIFIIGSSHYASYKSASVYNAGNFITPLGIVEVDTALGSKLIRENSSFTFAPEPHLPEHCIEVILPMLQYRVKKKFKIVPVLIGYPSVELCSNIAAGLKQYFNSENLFIISTDFSHYPSYSNAKYIDHRTAEAVRSNSPGYLLKLVENNERKNIPALSTSACGFSSVLTLLGITEKNENIEIAPIQYKNSGDSKYGDTNRVVGYYSMTVVLQTVPQAEAFYLTNDEKLALLKIARQTIAEFISKRAYPPLDTLQMTANLRRKAGAFVTLNKNNMLRGCIGHFAADMPLYQTVRQMAVAAATQDYRFAKVSSSEINEIEIEISVLSPMKKISSANEIVMGRNGIYIQKGMMAGTFLPQVAVETGWDKIEFLENCAMEKAGLGRNGWKDAEVFTYEAKVFGEKDFDER